MKVKAAVIAAVAIQQVQAQQANQAKTAANPFNPFSYFAQPPAAPLPAAPLPAAPQPVAAGTPADPFSQMMAHGHAMLTGQPVPGGQAATAANPFDPFKMMNDAATQAHAHMSNMHASTNAMVQQGSQAAQQMMDAGHQTMQSTHEAVMGMLTTTLAPAQTGPISRSCPTKLECFSDHIPGMSCSGVQGGASCIDGKMFPFPQSGICSCTDPQSVCSYRPNPSAFSLAQCTHPSVAYTGANSTRSGPVMGGPVISTNSFRDAGSGSGSSTSAPAAKAATCAGRCDTPYDPSFPCQCNDKCFDHNNCCTDKGICGLTTTLAPAGVVFGGTSAPNPLSTTLQSNAYDWVPGFAQVASSDSRLYDAHMEVKDEEEPTTTTGPSSKMLMAITVCMLTYATMIFAVVRGVSFVRRSLSDQRRIDFVDAELALEGPVE